MKSAFHAVKQFITSEDGPTAVEYAVVVALIIIGCIAALGTFSTALQGWFTNTAGTVDTLPTS
jgi:pilus assembly protein Flp/PilA